MKSTETLFERLPRRGVKKRNILLALLLKKVKRTFRFEATRAVALRSTGSSTASTSPRDVWATDDGGGGETPPTQRGPWGHLKIQVGAFARTGREEQLVWGFFSSLEE